MKMFNQKSIEFVNTIGKTESIIHKTVILPKLTGDKITIFETLSKIQIPDDFS